MIQKDLLRGVAAQIAENYEKAEVPMYSDHLHLPNRDTVIGIIKNLQKVIFPAYFGGTAISRVTALGTPLGLVHWKRASSPVEAGTSGFL